LEDLVLICQSSYSCYALVILLVFVLLQNSCFVHCNGFKIKYVKTLSSQIAFYVLIMSLSLFMVKSYIITDTNVHYTLNIHIVWTLSRLGTVFLRQSFPFPHCGPDHHVRVYVLACAYITYISNSKTDFLWSLINDLLAWHDNVITLNYLNSEDVLCYVITIWLI